MPTELQMLETGRIRQEEDRVQGPYQRIALMTGQNKVKDINHELLKSENTSFLYLHGMCLSKNGSIIVSGQKSNERNCWLKYIRNGVNLWEVNTGQNAGLL